MVTLLSVLNLFGERTLIKNVWLGILLGLALLFDIPNLFILLPVVLYVIYKHFNINKTTENKLKLTFKLNLIGLLIGVLPFIALFGWYNYKTTGSYTKIAQSIGRSEYFQPEEYKIKIQLEKSNQTRPRISLPFNTRDQGYNLYILLVSNERGWLTYSPIVLIGFLGLILKLERKKYRDIITVLLSVIFAVILIYSLFGAHGGWAFGPRYLIPATAILAIGIGISLDKYKKKAWFIPLFIVLTTYSVGVNVLGAMTTSQVPPKVEAVNLPNPIPYTYEYNWQLLTEKKLNSSLFYNLYANKYVSPVQFTSLYAGAAIFLISIIYTAALFEKKKEEI
jgi:hypothetical protein